MRREGDETPETWRAAHGAGQQRHRGAGAHALVLERVTYPADLYVNL